MVKKRFANTVYKKWLVLPKPKLVARLLASDFPAENPRTQTRNVPYTKTLAPIPLQEKPVEFLRQRAK